MDEIKTSSKNSPVIDDGCFLLLDVTCSLSKTGCALLYIGGEGHDQARKAPTVAELQRGKMVIELHCL